MRLYLAFIAVAIQCIPVIAQASLYKFDYVGHITGGIQGNGMGYRIGDSVSGHLEFNLANSDLFSNAYTASYRARNDGTDFVTSTSTPTLNIPATTPGKDLNWDQVYVYNGYQLPGSMDTRTNLVFADVYHHANPWISYGFQINVMWNGLDWFNQGRIPGFDINTLSPFVDSNTGGTFFDDTAVLRPDGTVFGALNTADFRFDHMKLSLVGVPEPSTFILLLVGGIILMLRRRLMSSFPFRRRKI